MIRFTLTCADGHSFESWFSDGATYDRLAAAGHVGCAVCGSTAVSKALMAPRVSSSGEDVPDLSGPKDPAQQALAALRAKVEAESDYVGRDFAAEARRIHDGEADARGIWGEASGSEAKALVEDGIPVLPLPFGPRKTH